MTRKKQMRVKIIGAGSIGNHMAHASRELGWDVTVVDLSHDALIRMRDDIYPSRYGAWDPTISLRLSSEAPNGKFDLVIIGTPPDQHLTLHYSTLLQIQYTSAPRDSLIFHEEERWQ